MASDMVQQQTLAGLLAAPFPAHDIEWRVQSSGTKSDGKVWAKVLAYVTARGIMERLDLVFGPGGWQTNFVPGPAGGVVCKLSAFVDDKWVTKEDGAENTDIESVKGGLSSALKRAAVSWGIGRYLYRLDEGWATITDQRDGTYTGKTKEGMWFGWHPPILPSWAIAYDPNAKSPTADKPQTRADAPAPASAPARESAPASNQTQRPPAAPATATPAAAPAARPAASVPRDAGYDWREVIVPPFIKKYAGKELQDMLPRDLAWWAANYEPKPYKGSISPKDVAFKAALVAGSMELNGGAEGAQADAPPNRGPTDEQLANRTGGADEDVPF